MKHLASSKFMFGNLKGHQVEWFIKDCYEMKKNTNRLFGSSNEE